MCGIVGAIAERNVVPLLLAGLQRLEYRGYDSAGVATVGLQGDIQRVRSVGKVSALAEKLSASPQQGTLGIAHTRWATHGEPSERNAHPHMAGEHIVIVHNGIIENFQVLKTTLQQQGSIFHSDTDTEVVAHLLAQAYQGDMLAALKAVQPQLSGAYALAIVHVDEPETLYVLRSGSPLVIGMGIGEHFVASDALSLLPVTRQFIYLEEGDMACLTRDSVRIIDRSGQVVSRALHALDTEVDAASKGPYKHFMAKEIHQQPQALNDTIAGCINDQGLVMSGCFGVQAEALLAQVDHVQIIACGTSYHAGMVAKYWLEQWAQVPCNVEVASEYRYRNPVVRNNSLFLSISQSGETADTLAALRQAKENGYVASMVICNVPNSSLVRESDMVFMTRAGAEMGVASTKAFTTQLAALFVLANLFAQRDHAQHKYIAQRLQALQKLPKQVEQALQLDTHIATLARQFIDKDHALFLGRGVQYPIALEGALKLKEISYIHAEAYPAGELKHGPLALVDKTMPVIAIASQDSLLEKIQANLQEVKARGGVLFVFTTEALAKHVDAEHCVAVSGVHADTAPLLYTVPLQMLAYHVAVLKGTDVDQPRNLAKSVTVE